MGNKANITHNTFPKQSTWLGEPVEVCFHYDTSNIVMGKIVRDDREEPWITIFQLDDGRFVLATECQYSPKPSKLDGIDDSGS